jgi:crotonobetainyl-CoA:carnitine CoA-transferase CaiB-like acyl-CoA transferase
MDSAGSGDVKSTSNGGPLGPLEGLRVIEMGQLIAAPFAGHLLADFGADLVKVELPGEGDSLRQWGQNRVNGRTLWWSVMSRNKRCITLNLRVPEGQRLLKELIKKSDALIENFRPGTLERWGLSPAELFEVNPGLVIARVSGFGQTGPYASRGGYASVGEAMGGLRYVNGYPNQPPPRTGISLGDPLAGMFATLGLLMALRWRDYSGSRRGQVIDASIMESCYALMESTITEYDKLGVVRQPSGTGLKGIAPSNIYRSKDGKWVVIAANADNLFRRLCKLMGQLELAEDARFNSHAARGANSDVLDTIISDWVVQHDAKELDTLLNDAGVVCGPIYTIADIYNDPHYAAREMIVRMKDDFFGDLAMPGVVPKLTESPGKLRWTGPQELGPHNSEVYGELLGLSQDDIDQLKTSGVI